MLSGTCGVQNAVITNSGWPIYVTPSVLADTCILYFVLLLPCPTSANAVIDTAGHNIFFPMQVSLKLGFPMESLLQEKQEMSVK